MEIVKFLTRPHNKTLPYFQILLLVYTVVLTLPDLIMSTSGGLDPSWMIGLHKANIQGLIHGTDIIFTYGPLGFLNYPLFVSRNLWLSSAAYILLVYALTLVSFSLYIRKTKANLLNTAIFAFFVIAVFNAHKPIPSTIWAMSLPVLIFSYLYTQSRSRPLLLIGLALFYSVLPFIKFSNALTAFIIAAAFLFVLAWDKRYKEALLFLLSILFSFVVLSLLLLKSPKAMVMYLYGCLQIATGYADAMAMPGDGRQLLFSAFAWLSFIALFSYNAFKKRKPDLIYLAFSFAPLFVSFKEGFTRGGGHLFHFYSIWIFVFVLYYLSIFSKTKILKYAVLLLTLAIFYQYTNTFAFSKGWYVGSHLPGKFKNLHLSYNLLTGVGTAEQKEGIKKDIGRHYSFKPETIQLLSGHTVDVFPWDIAITELYGFRWHPRPAFQAYSVYTPYLDSLNARHFSSDSAPQYVLYKLSGTIDGKHLFFFEPATFRMLLLRYEFYARDGEFVILQKKDTVETTTELYINTVTATFGEMIPLPKVGDGLLFARIHIEYSLLGHALKFLFKPPRVYFGFFKNDQRIAVYRFIFTNAANGLFLSKYIDSYDSFSELWKGNIKENFNRISIYTDRPVFFNNEITVEFFKVVTKINQKQNIPNTQKQNAAEH